LEPSATFGNHALNSAIDLAFKAILDSFIGNLCCCGRILELTKSNFLREFSLVDNPESFLDWQTVGCVNFDNALEWFLEL